MSLIDVQIRKAKASSKQYKLFDRDGLYILVKPTGVKIWRYKYHYAGIERLLSFGKYPEVSLVKARVFQFEARKLLVEGIDPGQKKREEKQLAAYKVANTFEAIAKQWHEASKHKWTSEHAETIFNRLKTHLFPKIGHRPITNIKPLDILSVLTCIEAKGKFETTHKLLNYSQNIFRFAVITGRLENNPARELSIALKPRQTTHFPTIKADQLKDFLKSVEVANTSIQNKIALKLQLITFLRSSELRKSKWECINFENKRWLVPAELMKMKQPHVVPLSEYAISLLKELSTITGDNLYLFPNNQHKKHPYMSENTINYVIELAGYKGKLVGHGFRSLASTTLNEHGFNSDAIERQLAHKEPNKIRAAYNHAEYMPERIEMMEWWGEFVKSSGIQ